jgi:Lambda phage tail tube protein, TTP
LSDSGTLQLDYNAAPNSAVQTALREAKESGDQLAFKITFPNSGGTVIMIGTVQSQNMSGSVNDVWKGSASIKLTGPIFVL